MKKTFTELGRKMLYWRLSILCLIFLTGTLQLKSQTVNLFYDDFSSSSFNTNNWTFDPGQGNWSVGYYYTPTGGTSPNAAFSYSPTRTNYSYAIVSPVINASGFSNLTLDYKLILDNYSTGSVEQFKVEFKKLSDPNWTLLTNYTNQSGNFSVSPSNVALVGMDNSSFQVRFVAYGVNSWNLNAWGLDDIYVKGSLAQACAGQPSAGTLSGPASVCPNQSFQIHSSGFSIASGETFQWLISAPGANSWSVVPGFSGPNLNAQNGTASSHDFRLVVTCDNSGLSDTSGVFTLNVSPFYNCYCSSSSYYTSYDQITNVSFGTTNNSSTCQALAPGAGSVAGSYSNYTTLPAPIVYKGTQVPFSVQIGTCYYTNYNITKVYIDYNHDGVFSEPSELAYVSNGYTYSSHSESANLAIDTSSNILTGVTRMRVIMEETTSASSISPCGTYYSGGETEDYLIDIEQLQNCSGQPSAGTITGPVSAVCPSAPVTINNNGYTFGNGMTYQWMAAQQGSNTWGIVPPMTTPTLNAQGGVPMSLDFRVIATCSYSGLSDTSNVVSVSVLPFNQCYCTPGSTNPNYGDQILNVSFAGINNSTSVGNSNGYNDYTQSVTPANIVAGQTYPISMVINYGGTEYGAIWIDFDQNGAFESSEYINMGQGTNLSSMVTVPGYAQGGITRMRARSRYSNALNPSDACIGYSYGETEDYAVNITVPTPCSGIPNAGTIYGHSNVCASYSFVLNDTTLSLGNGISYQWEQSQAGQNSWTAIPFATNQFYASSGISASTDFRLAVTCINSLQSSTSNVFTVNVAPSVTPTASINASTTSICSGSAVTFTATTTFGGNMPSYQWVVNGWIQWGATDSVYTTTGLSNGANVYLQFTTSEQCYTQHTAYSNGVTMNVTQSVWPAVSISSNNNSVCEGTNITFYTNNNNGGSNPTYQWYLNGSAIAGETNPTYSSSSLTMNNYVYVEMTSNAPCAYQPTVTSNYLWMNIYPIVTPTASIYTSNNTTTLCSGSDFYFMSNVNNPYFAPNYQWYLNGNPVSGETNWYYHATNFVTGDSVYLVITTNNPCATLSTVTTNAFVLNVLPSLTPAVSIVESNNNICYGTPVTFTATTTNAGNNPGYWWEINGSVVSNAQSLNTSTLNDGDVVSLMIGSSEQCYTSYNANSNNITMSVTPSANPTVSISASNPSSCVGTNVIFTSNVTNGGASGSYQWYVNFTPVSGETNNTYSSTSFNNGDLVYLLYTTGSSCYINQTGTSNWVQLSVAPYSTPTTTIYTNNTDVCAGASVNFWSNSNDVGSNPVYQWYLNGNAINGETNWSYNTSNLVTNDQVSLVVTSSNICSLVPTATSNTLTMVVNPYVTPTASIVASQTSICSGSAVQFTATSTNGGNSPFYVWVVNGSVWSFGTTFYTNNLNDGDVVLATLWTSAQCSTIPAINSNNITMSVTPSVTPTIAIAASNNNTCSGTSISFTSNITNGGTNPAYQWFINGSPVSGATNAQYNTATLNNNEVVSCQLTSNETCVTAATVLSNNINMVVIPLVTYYADADNDGFGNPNQSTTNCTGMPQGYVTDNTDCNDADPLQHPGQHWFIDNDGDGFGTGTEVIQCLRPLHGYLSSQLIATTGDCDDNNANINPNAQKLTFSASTGFNGNSLILPQSGSQSTTFQFEVVYTDINNQMPPAFFPRVNLDYEGNGVYNNANDRNIVMSEVDANDVTTSDGKKYYASINTLPTGTDWQTRIMISNNGCNTIIGPFNYPDVLIQPDLEIFANDITFSDQHPAVSSPLTVNAVVHNKSDFTANNFVVHLHNQYDSNTVYPDVTVANLAPHASTTVSWNITTPAVPSWNPMQVVVDYTNVINESNELNNSAIRPFTNGNYNLPGGIHAYASVTPTVSPTTNYWLSISGSAYYFDTAVPLQDSSVAGATVNFTIVETGASFSAYTNSAGQFVTWFPSPQIPGLFHITGTVTDYTLTGNFSTVFEVQACTLPEMTSGIQLTSGLLPSNYLNYYQQYVVLQGTPIGGNFIVSNSGYTSTGATSVLGISQTGGTSLGNNIAVPVIAAGGSFTQNFSNLVFNTPGTYTICTEADATNTVTECNESNNTSCVSILVLPALPDIIPSWGPAGTNYFCNASQPSFTIYNAGGVATGQFSCRLTVYKDGVMNSVLYDTINNINALSYTGVTFPYNHPAPGNYTYELYCDWNNVVVEMDETNNIGNYQQTFLACKPDLTLNGCDQFNVLPEDPTSIANDTLLATIQNNGNATAYGPIQVNFNLSSGTSYSATYNGNLAPYQSAPVKITVPAYASTTQTLTAVVDPLNAIDELNESNNTISGSMCYEFQPVAPCGWAFWYPSYTINSTANLSVAIQSNGLYDASQVKTRFYVSVPGIPGTINLGDAVLNHLETTCYCPAVTVLPTNFVFSHVGVYTFTMVVDPDNVYTECDESNNTLVVQVNVTNLPDMRILSQHIAPSKLNPQVNEPISLNVTYENIGLSNVNDQMKLKVIVDNTTLSTIYPVPGLPSGADTTYQIPVSWSSNIPGIHVIRAIIDADNQVNEGDEMNNEATRAVVVGSSANLYFQAFASNNPSPAIYTPIHILGRVGNNGDLSCSADVELYRIGNLLDTIWISTLNITVPPHDSVNIQFPNWLVTDPSTVFIGKITNSSALEFTYDDNMATTQIGTMPVITLTSTPSCVSDSNGTLSAVVNGGKPPYTYAWSNGKATSSIMTHSGSYTLTVTDLLGRTATATGTILDTICQPACNLTAHISASGPLALCSNGTVTLTATSGTSYHWSNGATSQSITVNTAGNYYAVVTDGNCSDTTEVMTVMVKTMPASVKIKIVGVTTVCEPGTVAFRVDPSAVNLYGFNFQWNLGGTPISGATDTAYTASSNGGGSVTLTVSGSGCSKSSTGKTYLIKPLPTATFTAGGPTTFCAGSSVTLTAPTITGYTYAWFNNGASAGSGPSRVFKASGTYNVVAKLNNCTDTSSSVTLVVNPVPTASISATSPTSFCAGSYCTLTVTPTPSNGNYTYFIVNGNTSSNWTLPNFQVTTAGTYKGMVEDNNTGCVSKLSTSSIKTTVIANPTPTITPSGSVSIAVSGNVKLNASPTAGVSWQWYKNGVAILGATTKSYTATTAGSYTVAVTKTGCTGMSAATVVTQTPSRQDATTFSEGNFELSAYPNPVGDVVTITVSGLDEVNGTIQLMDFSGKLIMNKVMNEPTLLLEMKDLSSGVYLIRFKDNEGRTGTLKVVKE